MKEKDYVIKIGLMYLVNMEVEFYNIETEFIYRITLGEKTEAMLFKKEDAELMCNKIYIVTGAKGELIEYDKTI